MSALQRLESAVASRDEDENVADRLLVALAFGGKQAPPFGKKKAGGDGDPEDAKDGGADEAEEDAAEAAKLSPAAKAKYDKLRKKGLPHAIAMKAAGS